MNAMIDTVRAYDEEGGRAAAPQPAQGAARLNLEMVLATPSAMIAWRDNPDVRIVLIDHAEGRGFCAGGDVVAIANSSQGTMAARGSSSSRISAQPPAVHLPKPGVAFMDGVTMGGGVGIAQPCRYRVATENTRFAMPETTIGFSPTSAAGAICRSCPGASASSWR
jgi:enoyl-CoA hydratase